MSASNDLSAVSSLLSNTQALRKTFFTQNTTGEITDLTENFSNLGTFMDVLGPASGIASIVLSFASPDSSTTEILKGIAELKTQINDVEAAIEKDIKQLGNQLAVQISRTNLENAVNYIISGISDLDPKTSFPFIQSNLKQLDANQIKTYFLTIYDRFVGEPFVAGQFKTYLEYLRDYTDGNVSVVQRSGIRLLYYANMAKTLYMAVESSNGETTSNIMASASSFFDNRLKDMHDALENVVTYIMHNLTSYVKPYFEQLYNDNFKAPYVWGNNYSGVGHSMIDSLEKKYPYLDFIMITAYDVKGYDHHMYVATLGNNPRSGVYNNWPGAALTVKESAADIYTNVVMGWTRKENQSIANAFWLEEHIVMYPTGPTSEATLDSTDGPNSEAILSNVRIMNYYTPNQTYGNLQSTAAIITKLLPASGALTYGLVTPWVCTVYFNNANRVRQHTGKYCTLVSFM